MAKSAADFCVMFQMETSIKCWICGEEGKTGEHIVKASDLKSHFGPLSQEKPFYFNLEGKRSIPVGSIKSNRLKSKALICNKCNSSLTQPYDKAWEKLSAYLRTNWVALDKAGKLNLSKVFPGASGRSLLDVHLYFVKLFGCRIVEDNVPIDITEFSRCLKEGIAHNNVYIAIGITVKPGEVNQKYAARTQIQSLNQGEKSVFAAWFYIIDKVGVNVIYSVVSGNEEVLRNTWHPSASNRILRLANFET